MERCKVFEAQGRWSRSLSGGSPASRGCCVCPGKISQRMGNNLHSRSRLLGLCSLSRSPWKRKEKKRKRMQIMYVTRKRINQRPEMDENLAPLSYRFPCMHFSSDGMGALKRHKKYSKLEESK